ncbi:hypothetical protein SAMN02745121_08008 [Nannocystis exedens]|uniref:Uncharacterized protein n=1 Tax=Nannocystis exedens TaxID=54 RepID=A0A1I2HK68_9BACT|nr:hypothetical protein [Nannocystis exedens]PCC74184.1 hypothetical protein NAEX_07273 [Nannocystis exedens]SFF29823.1 hypothetical protein SAMN02745121_08008 [Nannocystis exedens]
MLRRSVGEAARRTSSGRADRGTVADIRIVDPDQADGLLARIDRAAIARAGKIFNVPRSQSGRRSTARWR